MTLRRATAGPDPTLALDDKGHRPWLVCLAIAVLACVARLLYVQHFATAMPFWDQWDAEGAYLLKPWADGNFKMIDLIRAHNEHRVLPSRLVTLASYIATGQWNNIFEARINAFLYALIPATLTWQAFREERSPGLRLMLALVALALALHPLGWENFLVGFQSQFYFLILFSIAAVSLAATRHENIIAIFIVVVLSIFATLTMASGMLTPVAAAFTYAIACRRLPGRRWPACAGSLVLLALAVFAYAKMPVNPQHQAMRAQSLLDLVDASSHVLGWPIVGYHWAALWIWLPGLVGLCMLVFRRTGTRTDIAMAGFYAWSAAQGLAIAFGRGHGLIDVSSRYSELLVPGLFANAWFALRLIGWVPRPARLRAAALVVTAGFFVTFLGGLGARTKDDWRAMQGRHDATELQSRNATRYLNTGDPAALDVAFFELPYPSADRLRSLLDDPTIRSLLGHSHAPVMQPVTPQAAPVPAP